MKIKHVINILFIILCVVPMMLFGISAMNFYNKKMENILENDLAVAAITQSEAINSFFKERESDLIVISDYDMVSELLSISNRYGTQEHTEKRRDFDNVLKVRTNNNDFVESISIIDKNFYVVACSQFVPPSTVSLLENTKLQYLNSETQFIQLTGADNKKSILALREIYDRNQMSGYIVEEINFTFFENLTETAKLFNNETVYIIDSKGNLVTGGNGAKSTQEYTLSKEERKGFSKEWEQREQSAPNGMLKYTALNQRYLSYYINLHNIDWIIITTVNIDEILETKVGYKILGITMAAILIVLCIAVNLIISIKLIKPLDDMILNFQKIKKMQDYSIRMNSMKNNELGIIISEINSLLEHIEKNMDLQKQKQHKLKERAEKDPLTELYNKKIFESLLQNQLKKANKYGYHIALLFIDIDDFKMFNTQYGHTGGDQTIQFVANTIKLWPYLSGRVGGDEFVVCMNFCENKQQLEIFLNELLDEFNKGVIISGYEKRIPVKCSIGAAISMKDETYDKFFSRADNAMYHVKQNDKNSYYIVE